MGALKRFMDWLLCRKTLNVNGILIDEHDRAFIILMWIAGAGSHETADILKVYGFTHKHVEQVIEEEKERRKSLEGAKLI